MNTRSPNLGLLLVPLLAGVSAACPDDSNRSSVALSVEWDAAWGYDASVDHTGVVEGSTLDFGTVATGAQETISVTLSNGGDALVNVCEIGVVTLEEAFDGERWTLSRAEPYEGVDLTTDAEPQRIPGGGSATLEVVFRPLIPGPAPSVYLSVQHDHNGGCDEEGPGLFVPIVARGQGEPLPGIAASPSSLSFDPIDLDAGDAPQTRTVLVSNVGGAPLVLGRVTLSDIAHFRLDDRDIARRTLAPGEAAPLEVTFHPLAPGDFAAEVQVRHNAGIPLVVPVQGTASGTPMEGRPVAVCGPTLLSSPFQSEQLDGTASYDPGGEPLSYAWTFTPPAGSQSTLDSADSPAPLVVIPFQPFGLDLAGTYVASLVVTNASGVASMPCTQLIEARPVEDFRVEIFWSKPDDLDLHLLAPGGTFQDGGGCGGAGGTDCYYINCVGGGFGGGLDWGVQGDPLDDPSLDLDDIQGNGPENTNIVAPADGTYTVVVHDYPGTVNDDTPTACTVNVYTYGALTSTLTFDIAGEDAAYYVAEVAWPSGVVTPCGGLSGC